MSAAARDALNAALATAAPGLAAVQGLYLGGSFGRAIADEWSDLDYVAVAAPGDVAGLVDDWVALVSAQTPVVHRMQRVFPTSALVNLITADWVRCDLLVETEERFASRAQDRLAVVFERGPLYAALPAENVLPPVRPEALTAAVEEFLRVLGLSHLAVHRDDPFTAQWGVALLRDQVRVFVLALEPAAGLSGALTLSRELPEARMALLRDLPVGGPDLAAALDAQQELTRRFLPMARAECAAHDARWPAAFVSATAQALRGVMPDAFCDWLAQQA